MERITSPARGPLAGRAEWSRTRIRARLQENAIAYVFLAPALIGLVAFLLIPLVQSLAVSFQNWQIYGPSPWVGLANYRHLLSDWVFLQSYLHAAVYAVYTIPAGLIWGIVTALALSRLSKARVLFRTLFFLPSVTSSVAVSIVWSWFFNGQQYGLFNAFLGLFGLHGNNWLADPRWALAVISVAVVWNNTGYWMLIFLAGLLNIPTEYYEAARVDGANGWHSFWRITLPLLSPTILYYLVIAFITVWTQFDTVYVMTGGGPANATTMPAFLIYTDAFQNLQMSYASAMAWVIGIIAFILAGANFLFGRRWVSYAR
jgi:multiple sugar transport system permease protein